MMFIFGIDRPMCSEEYLRCLLCGCYPGVYCQSLVCLLSIYGYPFGVSRRPLAWLAWLGLSDLPAGLEYVGWIKHEGREGICGREGRGKDLGKGWDLWMTRPCKEALYIQGFPDEAILRLHELRLGQARLMEIAGSSSCPWPIGTAVLIAIAHARGTSNRR